MQDEYSKQFESAFLNRTAHHLQSVEQIVQELESDPTTLHPETLRSQTEQLIARHPAVRKHAVVLLNSDLPATQVIAFVELSHSFPRKVTETDLCRYVNESLATPGLCVVLLDALPERPDGTLDKEALMLLGRDKITARLRTAPRSLLESKIFEIWQGLLGTSEFSVDDDFFAVGGHSLMATQVFSRIYEGFGVELPLGLLLEETLTVAGLAQLVQKMLDERPGYETPSSSQKAE